MHFGFHLHCLSAMTVRRGGAGWGRVTFWLQKDNEKICSEGLIYNGNSTFLERIVSPSILILYSLLF